MVRAGTPGCRSQAQRFPEGWYFHVLRFVRWVFLLTIRIFAHFVSFFSLCAITPSSAIAWLSVTDFSISSLIRHSFLYSIIFALSSIIPS